MGHRIYVDNLQQQDVEGLPSGSAFIDKDGYLYQKQTFGFADHDRTYYFIPGNEQEFSLEEIAYPVTVIWTGAGV